MSQKMRLVNLISKQVEVRVTEAIMCDIPIQIYKKMDSDTEESDEEDYSNWVLPIELLGVHSHCLFCQSGRCDFNGCSMVSCSHCHIDMHSCKLDDHLEICNKVVSPCINAIYGCEMVLRRDKINAHLEKCVASGIVCGRECGRKAVTTEAKMQLKSWGKGSSTYTPKGCPEEELDVLMALNDQKEIIKSYGFSRKARVKRRDGLNKKHPVLPLRDVVNSKGEKEERISLEDHDAGDSSDEEKAIEEKKMKKQRAMFANCWMCQYDPSSQHLHTLGNENAKFRFTTKKRKTAKILGSFYEDRNLMISLDSEFVPECILKSENIYFLRQGGTLYNRKCLCVVRRDHLANHIRSQHTDTQENLSQHIVRCPLWHHGCQFFTQRLRPRNAQLRYFPSINGFLVRPILPSLPSTSDAYSIEDLPVWALCEIFNHLSPINHRVLSMVSKSMRNALYDFYRDHSVVSIIWKKEGNKWKESGLKWEFSNTDTPWEYEWSPASSLSSHLKECVYSDKVEYEPSRVPVFPAHLLSPIMGSQEEAKADLYLLPDHLRRGDMVRLEGSHQRLRDDDWAII